MLILRRNGIALLCGLCLLSPGLMTTALAESAKSGTATDLSVPDMLEKALPAVVTVGVYKTEKVGTAYGFSANASDIAYKKELNMGSTKSSGSGFVMEHNGKKYVVTNAHVIDAAEESSDAVYIYSIDRTRYAMRIVGADSFYDVAVLEFTEKQPGKEIGLVVFRPDVPRIGETVFAIGNPLGEFPYTVTQGIIGGKNRVRSGQVGKYGYLQSSATTIWGNSGGPLLDAQGRVVGINSQIEITVRSFGRFVQPQLNFALEAPIAQRVLVDLVERGRVNRALVGAYFTMNREEGAPRLAGLLPGSPAGQALAGKEGYYIKKVNDEEVFSTEDLLMELEKVRPGDSVTFELEENKERTTVKLVTEELTQRRHGDFATFLLRHFASLELSRAGGGVEITLASGCKGVGQPCSGDANGFRLMVSEYDGDISSFDDSSIMASFYRSFSPVAAGLIIDAKEDEATLWQVKNPAGLGLIMRLQLTMGAVSLIGDGDDGMTKILLLTFMQKDDFNRLLMY